MKKLHAYILLDRSGSMDGKWEETLSSINGYVTELVKSGTRAKITVITFDEDNDKTCTFDVIRDSISAKKFEPLTNKDAKPRGMTPLYDAIGKVMNLAEGADKERTVILIMTDGLENASREVTQEGATSALDRGRARDWQVIMLGADFNAMRQGAQVGIAANATIMTVSGNYGATMDTLADKSTAYARSGEKMKITEDDRKEAVGDN